MIRQRDNPSLAPLVLVVDDDPTIRLLAQQALEQAGFRTASADGGEPALATFNRLRPDLMVLDVIMPDLDGFAVCATVRKLPGGEHLPILMMTGLDDVASINRAYEVGATDFLVKPLHWVLLEHRIRYMLRAATALQQVRQSEIRLANAQRIARLGNWDWDVGCNQWQGSEQCYRLFGVPRPLSPINYQVFLTFVHPDDRGQVIRAHETLLKERRPAGLEYRVCWPSGEQRFIHEQAEAVPDEWGRVQALTGTVQDISERKQAEAVLRDYSERLQREVAIRTQQLSRNNEELRSFTHIISHDLSSPLVGLNGLIQELGLSLEELRTVLEPVLAELAEPRRAVVYRLLEDDCSETLAFMGRATDKMAELLEKVLKLARLGRKALSIQTVDSYQLVQDILAALHFQLEQTAVQVWVDMLPVLQTDAEILELVLHNLLSNALKYLSPERPGRVRVWAECGAAETRFHVSDNGRGIAETDLARLFELFRRFGVQDQGGEGVGLAYSRVALQRCGGDIWVSSQLDEGSTFSFRLPNDLSPYEELSDGPGSG
jgi:signal transduction histidine kinase/CheY-like chemotaxis protein